MCLVFGGRGGGGGGGGGVIMSGVSSDRTLVVMATRRWAAETRLRFVWGREQWKGVGHLLCIGDYYSTGISSILESPGSLF